MHMPRAHHALACSIATARLRVARRAPFTRRPLACVRSPLLGRTLRSGGRAPLPSSRRCCPRSSGTTQATCRCLEGASGCAASEATCVPPRTETGAAEAVSQAEGAAATGEATFRSVPARRRAAATAAATLAATQMHRMRGQRRQRKPRWAYAKTEGDAGDAHRAPAAALNLGHHAHHPSPAHHTRTRPRLSDCSWTQPSPGGWPPRPSARVLLLFRVGSWPLLPRLARTVLSATMGNGTSASARRLRPRKMPSPPSATAVPSCIRRSSTSPRASCTTITERFFMTYIAFFRLRRCRSRTGLRCTSYMWCHDGQGEFCRGSCSL